MKPMNALRAILLRRAFPSLLVVSVLFLAGCTLGETEMPNPPAGVAADRSVGVVAPVPAPIPHSLERREDCFACHAIGAVDAPPVPAGHEEDTTLCTTCHAVWLAPAIAASAPPAILHEVEGLEDCLVCHKLGTADAPRIPDNHDSLSGDICQTCHTQMAELTGGSVEEATVAEIPPIPHGLEGFSACSQCHEQGGQGIPRFPDDHKGRADDLCSACHEAAVEAPEPTSTPEATATPAEPTSTPEPTAMPTEAIATPEPTAVPTKAASTPEPTAIPTETPPTAVGDIDNGEVLYAASCAVCHGPEGEGTTIAPNAINDASLLAELTDKDLVTIIQEGVAGKMPASPNVSDEEALDLIALLRSWQ